MKKTINLIGKVLIALVLCTGLAVTSCYDDSLIKETLQDHAVVVNICIDKNVFIVIRIVFVKTFNSIT